MLIFDKVSMHTNLERFLDCVTPVVPSHLLPKNDMMNLNSLWHPLERENLNYFTLGDLWNCYDECSVYGVGVPITLDDGQSLVQYFVPYLSAIQIFTSNSSVNCVREETDSISETRDFFSDSLSDESDSEKLSRWDGSSEEGLLEHDNSWHSNDRLGILYFQYFERNSPYGRVPLIDKINSLAQRYPGLLSLRSVDLSPASWMSVSWYPIYHIPMGRTIKDLYTGFLTYHTISSSFQDLDLEDNPESVESKRKEGESISLPPFGMATYKMQGDVWISTKNGRDQERLVSLLSVADSWLKQLRVQHHDFNYFMGFGLGKTRTNDNFSTHIIRTKY
ncbi:uncharacterized protein LOC111386995 isoform X2 [Olea europaea var. sylvestris]|uniref:uncharacterized protein LOC111386995 isoform X2 n=1 Tax=Olea europaea var. sylvestris TaxID=158386 RepID=UPI000C1D4458|nr:uncharacterized protein LOC111386995 isoform X2 [Olea europaea var. sylvestris]